MNALPFHWLRWFSLAGSLIMLATTVYAGWRYRGKAGERYSPLNHFISELGEEGVSQAAGTFNAGLIMAGALLVPFMLGLGLKLGTVLGWIGAVLGMAACLAVALVGLYPMNNLKPHARAATTFFRMGLLTLLVLAIALFAQPRGSAALPRYLGAIALAGTLPYAAFMGAAYRVELRAVTAGNQVESLRTVALDPAWQQARPRVWALPALEWSVMAATLLWFTLTALSG